MDVLLVEPEYYTRYPPLGLLKLSAYHKSQGDTTQLVRGPQPVRKPDIVYVTSLFTWAWKPVHKAIQFYKLIYPDAEVWLGGLYASLLPDHAALSGADRIYTGLFKDAEGLRPDYSLLEGSEYKPWREWDGSIIFSSRGCSKKCGFCAVPKLEGPINSEKFSIKDLVWPKHTRIIFFDNNILASRGCRSAFDEIDELGLKVDFNQGLDAGRITDEVAERLGRFKMFMVRLAYDLQGEGPSVKRAIERLKAVGIKGRRIMVYALYNYRDDPGSFLERVKEILSWGAVCYPMRYQPIYGPLALEKNRYIAPKWDAKRLDMVQRARRVIGYGGAFPPYEGLISKFEKAKDFDDAFSLYPLEKTRNRRDGSVDLHSYPKGSM